MPIDLEFDRLEEEIKIQYEALKITIKVELADYESFIDVDKSVESSEPLPENIDDINSVQVESNEVENDDDDEDDNDKIFERVPKIKALNNLDELRLYAAQRTSSETTSILMGLINKLEREIYDEKVNYVQTLLKF